MQRMHSPFSKLRSSFIAPIRHLLWHIRQLWHLSTVRLSKENFANKAYTAPNGQTLRHQNLFTIKVKAHMIRKNNKIIALPLTEVIANAGIFDYEAKYEKGKSQEITPARVSKPVEDECKRMSALLFEKLNCKGMVRMDYIVNKQKLFLLDINTVPGLSEASIVPTQAACAGITLKELYNIVINEALQL